MARKRTAEELDTREHRPRREDIKRAKLSSSDGVRSNSSVPSSCSVSEDSALRSSPPASDHTRQSSFSSVHSSGYEESDSSLSSSSDESSDAGSDEGEDVIAVGGPKKPQISDAAMLSGAQGLQARLSALLPQLATANEELSKDGARHSMEDVEDGEQHIEMDLGLGVLEEKRDGDSGSDENSSGDESEWLEDLEAPISSGTVKREQDGRDTQVMDKLLGQHHGQRKAGIEDLG